MRKSENWGDDDISLAEAAKLIVVAEGTLRNWRTKGKGPPSRKIGYGVAYSRNEVEAWAREYHASRKRFR